MPVVRYWGSVPASIAEGSRPGDWVANLGLGGDLSRLVAVETVGPDAAFFSATWSAALGIATIRPNAALDYESFSAAGALPQVVVDFRFVFNDGTRQEDGTGFRVSVLDRDDTPPEALSFSSGGAVAAGAIGAAIGRLSVADPDTAGPFRFSFAPEDEWRFEVVDGVLKLRDGISLGWDDVGARPVIVEVSDGARSAAFVLDLAVTPPEDGPAAPYAPPALAAGEDRAGFALAGGGAEALTARSAADATLVAPQAGGLHRLLLDTGESVWLGPAVDAIRFADGRLELGPDGPAARAAALHRAVAGEDADGVELAPLAAALRAGAAWVEVAQRLLAENPALAALDDAGFVRALAEAALGTAAPDAADLSFHAERLASGTASRAQVAVDIALSPEALAGLAADASAGHWVADPFDAAAGLLLRPTFVDPAPASVAAGGFGAGWFM